MTGVGSRARRTDRPVSGSAPGTADAIVPRNVTCVPADTVRDAGRRDSATFGNAAGKKPGRRDDGNRASADWNDGEVRKSMNASAPWRFDRAELARVDGVDVVDVEHQVAAAPRPRRLVVHHRSQARDRTVVGQLLQRAAVGDRVAAAAAERALLGEAERVGHAEPGLVVPGRVPGRRRRARWPRCGRPGSAPRSRAPCEFVPDLSPRETKFAFPAAPAAAIASSAPTASVRARRSDAGRIVRRPDDHEVVPHDGAADALVGEPVAHELALGGGRMADQDVALAGAGVRDRLPGPDRDELQVVLRKPAL